MAAVIVLAVFSSLPPKAAGKTEPVPLAPAPKPQPERLPSIEPEAQQEGHTCGLHAVRMAYASYGVDPDGMDLRKRLGIDTPAIRWLESTTGMLPQDLLRVLDQDGFTWELLAPDSEGATERLLEHAKGQVALCVVPFGGSDFHWVTLRGDEAGRPLLLDPAGGSARSVDVAEFLADRAMSVVLMRVRRESDPPNRVASDGLLQLRDIMRHLTSR